MGELARLSIKGAIGVITVENPPVNALSPALTRDILSCVHGACDEQSIHALVLIGAGKTFIAGADIGEFNRIVCGQRDKDIGFHPMLQALEDCHKPVVCAIHGTALGGGLEVAMACHYRVCSPSAIVGQPEIKLGLIPGAGGTQRLPRLAGVAKALEMCALGDPVSASDAVQGGIADRLVEGDLLIGALDFAADLVAQRKTPRRTRDLTEFLTRADFDAATFEKMREEVRRRFRGRLAPLKAIDAIEAATRLPFDEGIEKERELFEECLFSDQSKALIRVFFGEREVGKVPGISKDLPAKQIRKIGIVGAGTMGCGIAVACANAGVSVILMDVSPEMLDRGMEKIRKTHSAAVKRGKYSQEIANQRIALVAPTQDFREFAEVDVAIEAVFESMVPKKEVFAALDRVCGGDAILATNTSSLDIDEISAVTSRPQQVIGLHFFAPANIMRLVEIVRPSGANPQVIASAMALCRKLGKIGVVVGNGRGFVGNRMFNAYLLEAHFLLEEGARVQEVDGVLYSFGMAMGPLATEDLSGLDIFASIRQVLRVPEVPSARQPVAVTRLIELGRLGQKSGAGWYRYDSGERKAQPDPLVDQIIEEAAGACGIERRQISSHEILDRAIYALINEGAKILEEGIAQRAVDIDIIYLNGYGFPAHRGGPMWYADTTGLKSVYERICEFQRLYGPRWAPARLLAKLAEDGGSFAEFDAKR